MYDVNMVTLQELVRMAELMGWNESIATQHYGWGLFAITASMGNPCTHRESRELAQLLVRELTAEPRLQLTLGARLHYAQDSGGLRFDMRTRYHPDRFRERILFHGFTEAGEWGLRCTDHATNYDLCLGGCAIGVQCSGNYLIDIVRGDG